MAMNLTSGGAEPDVMIDINTTPLIDVMLVLLVMLIITIPIQTHAVKLDMPRPNNTPPTTPPETVELVVDFDGTILWNNTPVPLTDLDGYLRDAATKDVPPEIHLSPNRLARYESVTEILARAQRLGVTKIGFVGIDQYN